jgi:hypothetical protein
MSHFSTLADLRVKLAEKADPRLSDSIELRLQGLIDALEGAWQRAETEIDFGTYSDKHEDMRNLARVQQQLEEAARAVTAACRQRLDYYR